MLATNVFRSLLRWNWWYTVSFIDYVLATEPLSDAPARPIGRETGRNSGDRAN